MNDSPLYQLLMFAAGLYLLKLWVDDVKAARVGKPNPTSLPGATLPRTNALVIAIAGAVVILLAETWGELRLGIAGEQSDMTWVFALCTLSAAVVEEIIFRGFLVIQKRGRFLLWLGIVAASVIFALLHQHLWKWDGGWPWAGGNLIVEFNLKGCFSTAALFVGSLWFYAVRFARFNPQRSLLPCFAAHAAKNLGVIIIKLLQGHLVGAW